MSLDIDKAATLLKALGHPLRLRIIERLADAPEHVGALAAELDAPQTIVSQQLRILRMHGLVAATRQHGQAVYRLIEPCLPSLLRCIASHSCASQPNEVTS